MEIWEPIKDYEGLYEVSSLGRVKSLAIQKFNGSGFYLAGERIFSPVLNNKGYLRVGLTKDKQRKHFTVHALVAQAFHDHTICGMSFVVDHIDRNKTNNHKDNLRVTTNFGNYLNSKKVLAREHKGFYTDKKSGKYVSRIMVNGKTVKLGSFHCEEEAAQVYRDALLKYREAL